MKSIIQLSKMLMLCMAVLFATDSSAQTFPIYFNTQQNQCVDLGIDTMGVVFTALEFVDGPYNGQVVPGIRPGSLIYCPDSNYVGTDSAFVYYCINAPVLCDTTVVYFTVQGNNCNLTVSVSPNSSPCMGPLPGAAATAAGGTPPYTYEWNNGPTGTFNCNLAPGTYCVTATDATGCTATSCTTISGCQVTVTVVTDSFGCLIAAATGGSGGYTYFWSDSSTGSSICNPTPGLNYCVTVVDAQSCAGFECGQVNCNLFGAISGTPTCLVVTTAGGSGDYSYAWSNGSAQGPTMCPGGAGNYCVTITDNVSGCTEILCDTIMGCTFNVATTQTGNCITASALGGTPPYAFQWSTGEMGQIICLSTSGTYYVTVTDAQGCSGVATRVFNAGGCLPVSIVLDSSGCMQPVITGGSPPFTYAWSDGQTTQTNCTFTNGITYVVTVTDVQGCSGSATFFIPCQISAAIAFDSLTNCYTATAIGGALPYTYMWSIGSNTATICTTVPGTYCVTVVDANGCMASTCSSQSGGCSFSYTFQNSPANIIGIFTASFDQSLQPASIVWDFADGTVITGNTITRLFNACGITSNVTMSLFDSLGVPLCSSSQSFYIPCDTLYNYCQAYFTSYQDSADNKKFHFVDQSVYNPISYQWNFGDGNLSTAANPVHTYANPGIYNVCLVIVDANGCSSTHCENVNAGNVQIQDLAAYLYHYTTVRPGFAVWVNLSYCNYGTTLMDGTVEYRYPAGTTFTTATPAPVAHNAAQRLLTFSFDDLLPGSCRSIEVDLVASTSLLLGSAVFDTVWVKPLAGDINVANNSASTYNIVIGSWDPNDKAVSPGGIGDDGEIPENTEVLTYKIRFQNTGTASAVNVVIRDMIDSNIDLTSLTVADASHEHITELIGNELVVTFNNIMLPDSNANEPESHGYIQVIAHLKPGLTRGTQIFNTAEIYFDFNEPVITNTVVNTLKDQEIGIGKIPSFNFGVMPNPAEEVITITGKFSRNAVYEIMNELGQTVLSDDVTSDKTQINIKDLRAGIFFIRVKSNDKVGVQRLFVTE